MKSITMKITKKILERIIREELEAYLLEDVTQIVKDSLPAIVTNKVAFKIYKMAKRGVQKKQISYNDFVELSAGLSMAIETGDKEAAETAVSNNSALKKMGLDVVIGDVTQKGYPSMDPGGTTWGAKLVLTI